MKKRGTRNNRNESVSEPKVNEQLEHMPNDERTTKTNIHELKW